MNKEITFEQVAHMYLRSELKNNMAFGVYYKDSYWKDQPVYFTPFINLIKPVKSNKFVAELLEINEGDEYVMAEQILVLASSIEGSNYRGKLDYKIDEGEIRVFEKGEDPIYNTYLRIWNGTFIIMGEEYATYPIIQTLLIAAGYNVYGIKNCKYE